MIVDHHLTINGYAPTALPRLSRPAVVRAWAVPADYLAGGLFVSVAVEGEAPTVPACAQAEAVLLGEFQLEPHPDALLDEAKRLAREQIDALRESRLAGTVTLNGVAFDADQRSAMRVGGAAITAAADPAFTTRWICADNTQVTLDAGQIADLWRLIVEHEGTHVLAARAVKDLVDKAVAHEDILSALAHYRDGV